MKVFSIKLLLFSILCAGLLYAWNLYTPEGLHDAVSWPILLFFALSTLIVHYYMLRSADGEPKKFVGKFMAVTALKLLAFVAFLIAVLLLNRDHARIAAVYFLVMYLLFSVFEVASLYSKLRK
jgi:cobalamin biosynthesis protein CobD/CbiB